MREQPSSTVSGMAPAACAAPPARCTVMLKEGTRGSLVSACLSRLKRGLQKRELGACQELARVPDSRLVYLPRPEKCTTVPLASRPIQP